MPVEEEDGKIVSLGDSHIEHVRGCYFKHVKSKYAPSGIVHVYQPDNSMRCYYCNVCGL